MPSVRELAICLVVAVATVACKGDDSDPPPIGSSDESSGGGDSDSTADGGTGSEDETGTGGETGAVDPGPWDTFAERPCPPDSFLSYENFGGPFVLTYCTGCHHSGIPADQRQGAPTAINFDDLDDIRGQLERMWARGGDHNLTMPPLGAAGDEERALFGEWLACGAPIDADM